MSPRRTNKLRHGSNFTPYSTEQRRQQLVVEPPRQSHPNPLHQSPDLLLHDTPELFEPSPTALSQIQGDDGSDGISDVGQGSCTSQPAVQHGAKLELLSLLDWDENRIYDEEPSSSIHYSIEWKMTLNNRMITKDTEQDIVLAPGPYWSLYLRPKLEKVLCKKLSANRRVRADDTNVVISVNERSERDLTKRFDETEIDWSMVEKQLLMWGELFRAGKKLRVNLSFNYVDMGQP
ncbi:hypothetical protein BS50DRAFT_535093, partial [Corynespora cassiicola Philippines]